MIFFILRNNVHLWKLLFMRLLLFALFIGLLPVLQSCGTCTKECTLCDGTGKYTAKGPHKGMTCTMCDGDGCWSDQR